MATTQVSQSPTHEISERDQFLAERRKGIGGSDVFNLLNEKEFGKGCSRWLMYQKLGVPEDYPQELDHGTLKRGTKMEALIAEEYEEATGRKVRRQPMRTNPAYPWALVHMDRQVLAGSGFEDFKVSSTGALEIKSFNDWAYRKMQKEGVRGAALLQVQHTMLVTDYPWTAFAGMRVTDFDLKHFDVPRDEGMIDVIKKAGDAFWKLKEDGELPDPLPDSEDIRCRVCSMRKTCRGVDVDREAMKALHKSKDLVQITSPEFAQVLDDRRVVIEQENELAVLEDTLNTTVKTFLAGQDAVIVSGIKVYHREQDGRTYFDYEGFVKKYPELVERAQEFQKQGKPFRSLRVYYPK